MLKVKIGLFAALLVGIGAVMLLNEIGIGLYPLLAYLAFTLPMCVPVWASGCSPRLVTGSVSGTGIGAQRHLRKPRLSQGSICATGAWCWPARFR